MERKLKFTQKPWKLNHLGPHVMAIDSSDNGHIALMEKMPYFRGTAEEQAANAKLIESAPEMYHALEQVLELLKASNPVYKSDDHWFTETMLLVANAISKARGES